MTAGSDTDSVQTMDDQKKTRAELITEINQLRKRIATSQIDSMAAALAPETGKIPVHDQHLFNLNPIGLWEEDFSEVKALLKRQKGMNSDDFKRYFDENPDAIFDYIRRVRIININRKAYELLNFQSREALLENLSATFNDRSMKTFKNALLAITEEKQFYSEESELVCNDGHPIAVMMHFHFIHDLDKVILSVTDISKLKAVERQLKESENRFKALSEATAEAIFISEKGVCVDANEAASRMFGYALGEMVGMFGTDFIADESKELVKKNMLSGFLESYDALGLRKDGTTFHGEFHGRMFRYMGKNVRITAVRDISDRKLAELKLKESSRLQEMLLREVNHRVKNNLYAIAGILYKEKEQLARTLEPGQYVFIDDLIYRIETLSAVHSLLSASKWNPLDIRILVQELINRIFGDLIQQRMMEFEIDSSAIMIHSSQVQHLALVLNEILTNIKKYVSVSAESNPLRIQFKIRENRRFLEIEIQDNGKGFPEHVIQTPEMMQGIGFDLIFGIVQKSLGGTVELVNRNGALYKLTVRKSITEKINGGI